MKYKIMNYKNVLKHENEAINEKVSQIARSPNGWFHTLKKNKGDVSQMPNALIKKRDSFIARTLAAYLKNPTRRRLLSLYIWSFDPN
jgi:hypothetical protein